MNKTTLYLIDKPFYKKWWFWVIVIIAFLGLCGYVEDAIENSIEEANIEAKFAENASKRKVTETTIPETTISITDYKELCESIDYKTLARNPDKYKGNNYKFTGEVIQVMEYNSSESVHIRVNVTKETNEYNDFVNWKDTIYAVVKIPKGEDRILEDDIITFWGECDGLYTYENVMSSSTSLPKINIKYFDLIE